MARSSSAPVPQSTLSSQSSLPSRNLWRVLLVLSGLMLALHLGYAPFFNPDEGRYASASLEMERGFEGRAPDWVVPHLNGVPRLNKPPLVYWTAAACMKVLGANEIAGRLPSALAAIGVLALLVGLGDALFDRRSGILGALIWATATFPFIFARVLNTDMLLCFAITLAMAGIWRILEIVRSAPDTVSSRSGKRESYRATLIAGIGMGLALLAKGPVGLALPILIGFAALFAGHYGPVSSVETDFNRAGRAFSSALIALARTLRDLRRSKVLWGALLGAVALSMAMSLPWLMAISARVPDFLHRFLVEENVGRFTGGKQFHPRSPIYFYLPIVLVGLLPWTAFLLLTSFGGSQKTGIDDSQSGPSSGEWTVDRAARGRRFLWTWALLTVGLFSFSGTKLVTYILPAFPAFCLLLGDAFGRVEAEIVAGREPRHWSLAIGLTVALNGILALALIGYLSNDKMLPRREGLPIALGMSAILLAGSVATLGCRKRGADAVFVTTWATAMLLHGVLLPVISRMALYGDAGAIFRALQPHLQPDDRIVLYREFQPTAIFYRGAPVTVVDFLNNSGLDDAAIAKSKYFVHEPHNSPRHFLEDATHRTFLLLDPGYQAELADLSGFPIIARDNHYFLVSNRPAPDGFEFNYVTPGKYNRGYKLRPY